MASPNLIICKECGDRRESHARGLCKQCYDRLFPGQRPSGFCLSPECPRLGQYIELRARGLCPTCYDRERKRGNLAAYPKVDGDPEPPVRRTPGLPTPRTD